MPINEEIKEEKGLYTKQLIAANLFFPAPCKGTFILPPSGFALWESIKKKLTKMFVCLGVEEVLLPSFIPLKLFNKEKEHVLGFKPELFFIKREDSIQEKKQTEYNSENQIVLRPTSEVLFYEWYRQIIHSYRQLPMINNQWCSAFRVEKNTSAFLRNTEFYWQEGHSIHSTEEEAKNLIKKLFKTFQNFSKNTLILPTLFGKKSEKEKFSGALETYTVETILPDGQWVQLATVHYFGNKFCQSANVKFLNKENKIEHPFSTSWGSSTRFIGAITKKHIDEEGIVIPFQIAPVQIAFILIEEKKRNKHFFENIFKFFKKTFRCFLYNNSQQTNENFKKADEEGCLVKIVIGPKEEKENTIAIIFRKENNERETNIIGLNNKRKVIQAIKNKVRENEKKIIKKNEHFLKNNILIKDTDNLKENIKNSKKNFFRFGFCNNFSCEEKIYEMFPGYRVRFIKEGKKNKKCLICNFKTMILAFFGRSY